MSADHLNRRDLLAVAGAAASAGLAPSVGWAVPAPVALDSITDMTMNSPSYAAPIGYGRVEEQHDAVDPLALALGG